MTETFGNLRRDLNIIIEAISNKKLSHPWNIGALSSEEKASATGIGTGKSTPLIAIEVDKEKRIEDLVELADNQLD